jgi:hypothetical protein
MLIYHNYYVESFYEFFVDNSPKKHLKHPILFDKMGIVHKKALGLYKQTCG